MYKKKSIIYLVIDLNSTNSNERIELDPAIIHDLFHFVHNKMK